MSARAHSHTHTNDTRISSEEVEQVSGRAGKEVEQVKPGAVPQDIVSRKTAPPALSPPQRGREDPAQEREMTSRRLAKLLQKKLSPVMS